MLTYFIEVSKTITFTYYLDNIFYQMAWKGTEVKIK